MEKFKVNQNLDYLFTQHQIDQEMWESMKSVIDEEYQIMIENVRAKQELNQLKNNESKSEDSKHKL